MLLGEAAGEAVRLGVDDEVDVALPVKRHIPGAVLGDRREAHGLEEFMKLLRFRRGVLDELEAVGAGGVLVRDLGPGGVVRVGTHCEYSLVNRGLEDQAFVATTRSAASRSI